MAKSSSQTYSIRSVTEADWPQVSAAFDDLTYEQSLTYALAAAERIGAMPQFVALSDASGQTVAAACLRIKTMPGLGRGIAWLPAGPLILHRDRHVPDAGALGAVFQALGSYAETSGHILRVRFAVTSRLVVADVDKTAAKTGFRKTERASAYQTVLIDCQQDDETLMKALHGKWRNPLRNALKAGLEIESAPIAERADRFHRLYRQVQDAKGFQPEIPPEFYYPLTGPDFEHDILIARKDGVDVAGMTIGRTRPSTIYLFGATADDGRRLNAGHFLMWHAILHSREGDATCFDLGGVDPVANPSVTRFKQRTGGTDVTAAGPYEYRPKRLSSALVGAAEALYTRMKARR